MIFRAFALLLTLAAFAPSATAQDPSPMDSSSAIAVGNADSTRLSSDAARLRGRRVRGVLSDGTPFTGTVRAVHGDTLVMREQSSPGVARVVPVSSIGTLEASRPAPSLARNVEIGAALGAIGGALVYLNHCDKHPGDCADDWVSNDRCDCDTDGDGYYDDPCNDDLNPGKLIVLGGAIVGGVLGYVVTPPSWRRVGLQVGASVTPAPEGGARASFNARVPLSLLARR